MINEGWRNGATTPLLNADCGLGSFDYCDRDYKLVGDQWCRGAVDPSLLVVAWKRMATPISLYQKSRHIYLYLYSWCLNSESKV